MRIRLETDAFFLILKSIQEGRYEMIASPVHFKEIDGIEDSYERMALHVLLKKHGKKSTYPLDAIRKRATSLYAMNYGVADSAHLAFAETTADAFITCDDQLLKKASRMKGTMEIINPVNFCEKEGIR
jgi:predicted nucleic acid-binding protein